MTRKKNDENSFVFYRSFYDVIHMIPDESMRSKAYEAICEYAFYGVEPDENADILVRMVFTQAKPQLDANAKRRADGKTGGRGKKAELYDNSDWDEQTEQISDAPKSVTVEKNKAAFQTVSVTEKETETTGFENENHWFLDEKPNVNVNANANVNENANVNANENAKQAEQKSTRFTPPTHDQVTAYIAENDLHVDVNRFMDYYIANGWKVGKNKMQSWKAALRNWHRHEKGVKPHGTITPQFGLCL